MEKHGVERRKRLRWIGLLIFLFLNLLSGGLKPDGLKPGGFLLYSQEDTRRYEPVFRWLYPSRSFRLGERGEILLELTNWDPSAVIPQGFLRNRIPQNAVLEESPPSRTGAGFYRYRLGIIPLSGDSVSMEAFSFLSGAYELLVPGIVIPVLPARQPPVTPPGITEESETDIPEFSQFQTKEDVLPFFQKEYLDVITQVQILWDDGRRAEALAAIRKNERDNLAGPWLLSLRTEMEQALGIGITENENWRPFRIPLWVYIITLAAILSVAALIIVLRKRVPFKNVTFRQDNGFTWVIVLILVLGLVFILLETSLGDFMTGNNARAGKNVVLRSTQSYRIPDFKGTVNDSFREGQSAIIGEYRGDWCFAETPDGRSGWIRRESVIGY